MTIGGGNARQSRGKWSQFGGGGASGGGASRVVDEQYGITDIEMGPRTTVTATRATTDGSSHSGGGETTGTQGTFSRDSDEYPIMGINKTTQVQWSVENVKGHDK